MTSARARHLNERAPLARRNASFAADPGRLPFVVECVDRAALASCAAWRATFSDQRKDHRYYEIVEDTLCDGFDYRYFVIRDMAGCIRAVQPFFIVEQDLLDGVGPEWRPVSLIRRRFPGFLKLRTLMVGCSAGEGHLASGDGLPAAMVAKILCRDLVRHAKALSARMVVLKEFPANDRTTLACFVQAGFARIPSMPMTRLNIEYDSFEHYFRAALSGNARRHIRRNLKATDGVTDIKMSDAEEISAVAGELYPLYLQVFARSKLHFEKLTADYFRQLGERMKDKARLLTWRRHSTLIAFSLNMVQADTLFLEYIGLDYTVALDLHLYHYIVRDIIGWAIGHKYRWLRSSGLNYDPKLHLRHQLDPIDLYVRHTSPLVNTVLKRVLPWLAPVRYDKTLRKFPDYAALW